jgi:molecular chaperone GrpE
MNAAADDVRPLVKALIEAGDALARAEAEIGRLLTAENAPSSLWQRFFRLRNRKADGLAAIVMGLQMSQRRIDRLMADVQLESVEALGKSFDPETMEAIETVAAPGTLPGLVVDELRRGYRWRGRVFRFAQVRVAK